MTKIRRKNFAHTLDEAPEEEEGQVEAVMDAALRPKRSLWRKMVMGGLALFGASVVRAGCTVDNECTANSGLGGAGWMCRWGIDYRRWRRFWVTEWRRLWRLRQRAHECDEARDLLHSHGTGKGRAFCEKLAQQAGIDQSHPALQRWYASIHETQNDREVVSLYAHLVQPVLDAQARREISRSAAESTLMIAVSPLALVDMAFIAWRNLRLINRIATLCMALNWGITAVCVCLAGIAEYRFCRSQRTGARSGDGLDVARSRCSFVYPRSSGNWCWTSDGTTRD